MPVTQTAFRHKVRKLPSAETSVLKGLPAKMQAAIWVMRLVLANAGEFLLVHNVDDFIDLTGEYLVWSRKQLELLLKEVEISDGEKTILMKKPPHAAWHMLRTDHRTSALSGVESLALTDRRQLHQALRTSLRYLERHVLSEFDQVAENAKVLQELLALSETECCILRFAANMAQKQIGNRLSHILRTQGQQECEYFLSIMLALDADEVRKAFLPSGLLFEYRLLERDVMPFCLSDIARIPVNVSECLSKPHDSLDSLMQYFIKPVRSAVLSAQDFPHLETDRSLLVSCLNGVASGRTKGINFLIYGQSGTGKTEFAKVLAHEAGMQIYEVANADQNGEPLNRSARLGSLRISQRFLSNRKDAIILFDEIEDVFPDAGFSFSFGESPVSTVVQSGKAWMNRLLENNPVPVLWVSNSIEQIDHAYLRRFRYHLEFRQPPLSVRQRILTRHLEVTAVGEDFIRELSADSTLTPAMIENAAHMITLANFDNRHQAEDCATRVIQHTKLAMGLDSKREILSLPTAYRLEYLNLDSRYPMVEIIDALKKKPSATLCFYGLPGTGKTALAEHIARTIERPLLIKRASDLLSKWLGESERNIARMFREAETEKAVLFLDEADSLMRNREGAQRNWEVSQVNELLQQMERFQGVFICATNLFANLDAAALRRFSFKISFKAMTLEQRVGMFVEEALQGNEDLFKEQHRSRLSRMDNLVPGDFAVVKRQLHVMTKTLTAEDFLGELESECKIKRGGRCGSIGFIS